MHCPPVLSPLFATHPDPDWHVRAAAFQALLRVGFATSDQLKLAAIGLLVTENANNTLRPSTIADDDEGYGEYYGDVISAVVALHDTRSVGALVGAINTGVLVSNALASFGPAALDAVVQQLSNSNVTMRGMAVLTIKTFLDKGTITDSISIAEIRGALNSASMDADYLPGLAGLQGLLKLFGITATGLPTRVQIDIKPGGYPNAINPNSNGVIPVAVLSTAVFDATSVDAASVRFGPGQATSSNSADVEDVNGDGRPDLVFHFSTDSTGIACGDTASFFVGKTVSGLMIVGSDSVLTVGCN